MSGKPKERAIDYLRDPDEIYRRSFAAVRAATDLTRLPPDLVEVAVRLVHACAMPEIVAELAWHGAVSQAAGSALAAGAPVLADARMVREGINRARLPAANEVVCTMADATVAEPATGPKTTRAAAAVDLWRPHVGGAVVAIGNAPTALFRLLELLQDGYPKPAAIFAFPVGFIGAAESKQALIEADLGVPYLTLRGRCGGSALAAAAVNAVAGAIT